MRSKVSQSGIRGSTDLTDECNVFFNCSGFLLNNWRWPQVADRNKFREDLHHTAAWPRSSDDTLNRKTVALIGNSSSGVQVLLGIIDRVKKVYVHIRNPTWIMTNFAAKFADPSGKNLDYTEEQKALWHSYPKIEEELNSRSKLYIDHTPKQKVARQFELGEMASRLKAGGNSFTIR